MNFKKRIAITPGEPAGIGPDIVLQIAQYNFPAELVVIADPQLLIQRAKKLKLDIELHQYDPKKYRGHRSGRLSVLPVKLIKEVVPGKLDKKNSEYVMKTLNLAAKKALDKEFSAVVTGPVHKSIINSAGINFTGHTEFFAKISKTKKVVMMLASKELRIALATTHLPLQKVPQAINKENLRKVIEILHKDLQQKFAIKNPHIFVAGLNPHAGENGNLGTEEQKVIIPVLKRLRKKGLNLTGPLSADTLFLPKNLSIANAFLVMYHDQGLPVIKFHDFEGTTNITLGLPFIRTSVDHGTALELAGTGKASAESLHNAIITAINISPGKRNA